MRNGETGSLLGAEGSCKLVMYGGSKHDFFHKFASHPRNINFIRVLEDDLGVFTTNEVKMTDIVASYFSNLFKRMVLKIWIRCLKG